MPVRITRRSNSHDFARPPLCEAVSPWQRQSGGLALAAPAYAGSCPADKLRPDGSGEKMNATPAKDVSDTVLTSLISRRSRRL